jgi:MFS family permease
MNDNSQRSLVAALGAAQTLAWGSTYYLPAILAAPMARSLDTSTHTVFGAFSSALIMAAILGPLAGKWIDRFGGRRILAASNIVFAAGLALLGAAQGTAMLFGAWLLIGVGMAMGLYEAAFATLAGIYGRNARNSITGITLIAGLASTICWPLSAWLDAEVGWRWACYIWAVAHLVFGLPLNRFFLPPHTQRSPFRADERTLDPRESFPARRFTMALLAFVFAVGWFTSTAMAAHLPRLLQEAGASPTTAIMAAALIGPAQVAGRLLELVFLKRFHPLLATRSAALAHPVGAFALLVIGPPAAILFAVMHGIGNGILTIAKGTLPLAIFGPDGYGLRQGVLMAPARIAQAGAPFLFAWLMDRVGASALNLSIILCLAGFLALLSITPLLKAERT